MFSVRDRLQCSTINHSVIHDVVHSFVSVDKPVKPESDKQLYQKIFERPFLECTSDYYRKKACEHIDKLSCCEYLEKVQGLAHSFSLVANSFHYC